MGWIALATTAISLYSSLSNKRGGVTAAEALTLDNIKLSKQALRSLQKTNQALVDIYSKIDGIESLLDQAIRESKMDTYQEGMSGAYIRYIEAFSAGKWKKNKYDAERLGAATDDFDVARAAMLAAHSNLLKDSVETMLVGTDDYLNHIYSVVTSLEQLSLCVDTSVIMSRTAGESDELLINKLLSYKKVYLTALDEKSDGSLFKAREYVKRKRLETIDKWDGDPDISLPVNFFLLGEYPFDQGGPLDPHLEDLTYYVIFYAAMYLSDLPPWSNLKSEYSFFHKLKLLIKEEKAEYKGKSLNFIKSKLKRKTTKTTKKFIDKSFDYSKYTWGVGIVKTFFATKDEFDNNVFEKKYDRTGTQWKGIAEANIMEDRYLDFIQDLQKIDDHGAFLSIVNGAIFYAEDTLINIDEYITHIKKDV